MGTRELVLGEVSVKGSKFVFLRVHPFSERGLACRKIKEIKEVTKGGAFLVQNRENIASVSDVSSLLELCLSVYDNDIIQHIN